MTGKINSRFRSLTGKKIAKWIKNTWWRNCFHETRALGRNARALGGDGEIMERNEMWAGKAQELWEKKYQRNDRDNGRKTRESR